MKILSNMHPILAHGEPSVSHRLAQRKEPFGLAQVIFIMIAVFIFNLEFFFPKVISRLENFIMLEESIHIMEDVSMPFYLIKPVKFYEYKTAKSAFHQIDLKKISSYSKNEFERLVLKTVRPFLRKRLVPLISHTLKKAMEYNIDPFWALAVMGTESHFNIYAKSYVDAYGPMQIMPGTAFFISKLLNKTKNYKASLKLRSNSYENIEMGIFYLGFLLKTFDGNHRLATTAYNMGPNGVRRRLRRNLPVGVRNNYLDKVRYFHKMLSRSYKLAIKPKKVKPVDFKSDSLLLFPKIAAYIHNPIFEK